jgi:L-alanine-DL-glutamate epimerase-like enolase superfamily enzyme
VADTGGSPVKITGIETIPVRVPINPARAIKASGAYHTHSPFLFVKVHTDEGVTGVGEVSCTPAWSGEDNVTAAHLIRTLIAPALECKDPTDITRLTALMSAVLPCNAFTKSGVEMALWDILGKVAGLPLFRLLGGSVRDFVPTKFSVSGLAPQKAAEIASWAVEQGFRTLKVKVGMDPDEDVARVRAVRKAVGSGVRLGVDANGGWPHHTAIATIQRMGDYDIYFAEQPVAAGNVESLASVRRQAGIPIIADESVYTPEDALGLIRAEAADVLSIYVGKGGIGPARNAAAVAGAGSIGCTVGSNLELGVGAAAMIHLAMSTPGVSAEECPCDILTPFYYDSDLLVEALDIKAGEARPPQKPGLGVELDNEAVRRYRVD